MKHSLFLRSLFRGGLLLVVSIALLKLLTHLLTGSAYGYFRDELYYVAASKRLALGYVDFPLFIAWLTAFVRATLGESLPALRLFPAIAGALIVLLAGLMARELGGGRFAQVLAAVAALLAPVFLAMHSMLTMDVFDQLWWVLGIFVVLKILKHDQPKWWLWFGLVAGLGLLTKVTIVYLGLALMVGLLLTPARKYLLSKWLWLGGVVALVFLVPYLIWQVQSGWPTVEFWGRYAAGKTYPVTLPGFLLQQILVVHPLAFPLALVGLWGLLFAPALKPYRALGWIYPVLFAIFAFQQAKHYFLAAAYPICFAAGAVILERFAQRLRRGWLIPGYLALLVITGIVVAPTALPLLPMGTYHTYISALGLGAGPQTERLDTGNLPQHFADRFGWPELAETVVRVYQALPPEEQARACIFTDNYGEAGALEFFGGARLPRVISGHNSYFLWGPQDCDASVLIFVPGHPADAAESFAQVEQVAVTQCDYCMPYETGRPILVARGPNFTIEGVWPKVKHFD
jgi:4-amino-4-deoxy-L-arabinose transferase-like glycosyltransferase